MKIAIIQEWLVTVGGSDKVVKAIADVFPDADIYTLVAKKQVCDELGIEYRSSHKLRFSTASIMYKNGMEDTELQKLLGHTTLSMTRHYLCNITSSEETANKMAAILG